MPGKPLIYLTFANQKNRFLPELKWERKEIARLLEKFQDSGRAIILDEAETDSTDLVHIFKERYPNQVVLFHFSGHGGSQSLEFEDKELSGEIISNWIKNQNFIKLVFLNACKTLEQAKFFQQANVPAIIVTKIEIEDKDAASFAKDFYTNLANGDSIQESYIKTVNQRAKRKDNAEYLSAEDTIIEFKRGGRLGEEVWNNASEQPWQLFITEDALNWKLGDLLTHESLRIASRNVFQKTFDEKRIDIENYMRQEIKIGESFETQETSANIEDLPIIQMLNYLHGCPSWHAQIIGEGGSGKTFNFLMLWRILNLRNSQTPIPLYIQLNKFDSTPNKDQQNFITREIAKIYLDKEIVDGSTLQDIWDSIKQPIYEVNGQKIPAIILLLDGFNEIMSSEQDQYYLLKELNQLAAYPGVQIIITSRFDISQYTFLGEANKINILPPSDNWIKFFLIKMREKYNYHFAESLEDNDELFALVRNPFNLSLYCKTASYYEKYKNQEPFKFIEQITSRGELMWNYYQAQLAIYLDRLDGNKKDPAYLLREFLILIFFPFFNFYLQQKATYIINHSDFKTQLDRVVQMFWASREELLRDDPQYEFIIEQYFYSDSEKNLKGHIFLSLIKKIFIEEIGILTESRISNSLSYSYIHDFFRPYLSAHIIYLGLYSLSKGQGTIESNPFSITFFSKEVLQLLGEIVGDHINKPNFYKFSPDEIEKNYKPTILDRLLHDYERGYKRNEFGSQFVYNVIETWNITRGTLAGADLSQLDLRRANLAGKEFSRLTDKGLFVADFTGALVHGDQFLAKEHRGGFDQTAWVLPSPFILNKKGNLLLTSTSDISILWNILSDSFYKLHSWTGQYIAHASFLSNDEDLLLISRSNNLPLIIIEVLGAYTDGRTWLYKRFEISHSQSLISNFLAGVNFIIVYSSENKTMITLQLPSLKVVREKQIDTNETWINFLEFAEDETSFFTSDNTRSITEWDTLTLEKKKSTQILEHISFPQLPTWDITKNKKDTFFIYFSESSILYEEYNELLNFALKKGFISEFSYQNIIDKNNILGVYIVFDWRNQEIQEIIAHDAVSTLCFSDERPILLRASANADGRTFLTGFYIKNLTQAFSFPCTVFAGSNNPISIFLPSTNPEFVILSITPDELVVINLRTSKIECNLWIPEPQKSRFILSPDKRRLLVINSFNMISEWDIFTGEELKDYDLPNLFKGKIHAVYSPDGNYIYAGYPGGQIVRFPSNSQDMLIISTGNEGRIVDVAYNQTSPKLAIALSSGHIQEFDLHHNICFKNHNLEHYTQISNISYDLFGSVIHVTDELGNLINLFTFQKHFFQFSTSKYSRSKLNSLAYSKDGRYRAVTDKYGNVTIRRLKGKGKNKEITIDGKPVTISAHFLNEIPNHLVVYRKATMNDALELLNETWPVNFSEEVTEEIFVHIYNLKKPKKPVWTGYYSYRKRFDIQTYYHEKIGDVVFAKNSDDYLFITHIKDEQQKSFYPPPFQLDMNDNIYTNTKITFLSVNNLIERMKSGNTFLAGNVPILTFFNMPDVKITFNTTNESILLLFSLSCIQADGTFIQQLIIGEITIDNPSIIKLSRINTAMNLNSCEFRLVPDKPKNIGIFAKDIYLRNNIYYEYAFEEQVEALTLGILSSYPSTTYKCHVLIPEAKIKRSLIVLPEFFLFGCSFEHLNPDSIFTESHFLLLRPHGAIFDESDRTNCKAVLEELSKQKA